ncbi:MAG: hypothetical protein H7202_04325 [Pedobacter sp.]|nr:hypothetical protein [Pedobacter sp.]
MNKNSICLIGIILCVVYGINSFAQKAASILIGNSGSEYKAKLAYLEASLGHSFGGNLNSKLLNNGAFKIGYLFNNGIDIGISPWTMYATRFNNMDYTVKFAQFSLGYRFY